MFVTWISAQGCCFQKNWLVGKKSHLRNLHGTFSRLPKHFGCCFTSINRKDFEEQPPTTWRVMSSDGVPAIYRCRMVLFLVERTYVCVCVCLCVCVCVCLCVWRRVSRANMVILRVYVYTYIYKAYIDKLSNTMCIYIYIHIVF